MGFEPTFSTTATVLVFIRHRWYLPKFCWRGGIRTHLLVSPLRRFVNPDHFYRVMPLLSNMLVGWDLNSRTREGELLQSPRFDRLHTHQFNFPIFQRPFKFLLKFITKKPRLTFIGRGFVFLLTLKLTHISSNRWVLLIRIGCSAYFRYWYVVNHFHITNVYISF